MLTALMVTALAAQIPTQAEMRRHLKTEIIGKWLPREIDPTGGFHQNFDPTWKPLEDDSKSVVYQARLTWLASIGGLNSEAEAGAEFIMDNLWDRELGGCYWSFPAKSEKHVYGNAFALYALARHANALKWTKSPKAEAAMYNATKIFKWLEKHAHDSKLGGWHETLSPENEPILTEKGTDAIGTPYGVRSMNTTIHILEALVEYYVLTHDKTAKTRLKEAFDIVSNRYVSKSGELYYYLSPDYQEPMSLLDSYGHELETSYLLLEAAEILGKPNDKTTWRKAKSLVDHCLKVAWDDKNGGFFYEGHLGHPPSDRNKVWWTTAEGLNALRIFAERFGGIYQTHYSQLWNFVLNHQLDKQHGGWHPTLDENSQPIVKNKSDAWTEAYHQARAVYLCSGQSLYPKH